jgi:hypothetical protein
MLTHSYGCNPIFGLLLIFDRIMLQVSEKLKATGRFSDRKGESECEFR